MDFRRKKAMREYRAYTIEFKRQVVAEERQEALFPAAAYSAEHATHHVKVLLVEIYAFCKFPR